MLLHDTPNLGVDFNTMHRIEVFIALRCNSLNYCVMILCQNILLREAEAEMGYLFHSRRGWNAEREERERADFIFPPSKQEIYICHPTTTAVMPSQSTDLVLNPRTRLRDSKAAHASGRTDLRMEIKKMTCSIRCICTTEIYIERTAQRWRRKMLQLRGGG